MDILDPSKFSGALLISTLPTILIAVASVMAGWFLGPLKWLYFRFKLKARIMNCRVRFVYNPDAQKEKILRFLPKGVIESDVTHGRHNEHRWRIKRGKLEILNMQGHVYSRFYHDKGSGHLKHTNDLDTHSIPGQYMIPQWHDAYSLHAISQKDGE